MHVWLIKKLATFAEQQILKFRAPFREMLLRSFALQHVCIPQCKMLHNTERRCKEQRLHAITKSTINEI